MVVFPNCKINLGLRILSKREDGYHNLETFFFPAPLNDVLELIRHNGNEETMFTSTGDKIDGEVNNNLCIKAYQLLKKDFPELPPVKIHLHKAIPIGAGLGGGSADGAFMLKLLNDKFQLGISRERLIEYALQLGSDCPFFIINKPCFATGRGEIMEEIELSLAGYHIVLINPGIHVNTGIAFKALNRETSYATSASPNLKDIINLPVANWKEKLANDFEVPVFSMHPVLAGIKQMLYDNGAVYASMSGSGSTVFGIFDDGIPELSLPETYFVKTAGL
jgi:4-diphosphocytidyl-2-C-methyl-D-erythritol kinase